MTNNCGELLPDPIPDHPLLNGRVEIGRGENTIVLDGDVVDGQARVFKVLSSPTDYAYYTAPDRPTGRISPSCMPITALPAAPAGASPSISSRSRNCIPCLAPAMPPKWPPRSAPPISTPA
jgi:hypothetical protein